MELGEKGLTVDVDIPGSASKTVLYPGETYSLKNNMHLSSPSGDYHSQTVVCHMTYRGDGVLVITRLSVDDDKIMELFAEAGKAYLAGGGR